jgi:hypothetical protein
MDDLPSEILKDHILSFVGDFEFRYISRRQQNVTFGVYEPFPRKENRVPCKFPDVFG